MIEDLVLKGTDEQGGRLYNTTDKWEDNYKHQLIAVVEFSRHEDLTNHITDGIDRLNRDPLPVSSVSSSNVSTPSSDKEKLNDTNPPIVAIDTTDRSGKNPTAELKNLAATIKRSTEESHALGSMEVTDAIAEKDEVKIPRMLALIKILDEYHLMSAQAQKNLSRLLGHLPEMEVEIDLKREKINKKPFDEMVSIILKGCLQGATLKLEVIGNHINSNID